MSWIRLRRKSNSGRPGSELNLRHEHVVERLEDRLVLSSSPVVSQLFYNQLNKVSDNSGEFLFNRFGGNTTLDVGDILLANFQIETIEDLTGGGGTRNFLSGSGNDEFTGFSAIQVKQITPAVVGFNISFGPLDAAGRAAIAADPNLATHNSIISASAAGSMIVLMDDGATHNYERKFSGAFAASGPDDVPPGPNPPGDIGIGPFSKEDLLVTSLIDGGGTRIIEFGFTGAGGAPAANQIWTANALSLDVALVTQAPSSFNFGTVNFGLDITVNQAGLVLGKVAGPAGLVDFGGNANLQGVGLGGPDFANTPFDAFDDFNANFKPLSSATPQIDIEKTTDGSPNGNATDSDFNNEDSANGAGVPVLNPGDAVVWTYQVTNTGTVPIAKSDVTVTDSIPGVTPIFQPGQGTDNGDNFLSPGEIWIYKATGTVLDLTAPVPGGTTIVTGCGATTTGSQPRKTYENNGTVTIPGATDIDLSHYCNPTPKIDIEKKTTGSPNGNGTTPDFDNEDSANGTGVPVLNPGDAVTWTYQVKNTGLVTIPMADVTVTDSIPGVTPVFQPGQGTDNGDNFLAPGEIWIYTATGTVLDLTSPTVPANTTVTGCGAQTTGSQPRKTYENNGTVTIPGATDSDLSHYCNPTPKIDIEKKTTGSPNGNSTTPDFDNEDSANGTGVPVLNPGDAVTWTYQVKNIGLVTIPKADVTVTDSIPGVNPVFQPGQGTDNGDNFLSPGEIWIYRAIGTVLNLAGTVPNGTTVVTGCGNVTTGSQPRNTYENNGTVTIPGATDSDLSHYCNPPGSIHGTKLVVSQNPELSGRMTGGGSVFTAATDAGDLAAVGTRVTHGFEIHCDPLNVPNNIEINWHGVSVENNFHLTNVTTATCTEDPSIIQRPPAAPFDTYVGVGTGTLNGQSGYVINWTFVDAGEPGTSDTASYFIFKDTTPNGTFDAGEPVALSVSPKLITFGNQQAHSEKGSTTGTGIVTTSPGVGFTIHLIGTGTTSYHDHTVTGATGSYDFSNVPAGTYMLCEEYAGTYTQVNPLSGPDCTTHTPLIVGNEMGPNGVAVTLAAGQSYTVPAAGDFKNQLEQSADGRMTGGGSIFQVVGDKSTRVTHGFEIHCNASTNPQRLEVNWKDIATGSENHFHLLNMTAATCIDTAIIQAPPDAPIDTYFGVGNGRFSGTFGGVDYKNDTTFSINFVFTDGGPSKGEPGVFDTAKYLIFKDLNGNGVKEPGDIAVLEVGPTLLTFGNHQAHVENKDSNTNATSIHNQINQTLNKMDGANQSQTTIVNLASQLLALFDQYYAALAGKTTGGNSSSSTGHSKLTIFSDGATNADNNLIVTATGQSMLGDVLVSIQDPEGQMDADQLARIRDAISDLNVQLGPTGVHLTEVESGDSDLQIRVASTSDCGGVADGVLGCTTDSGAITIIQGWNWYTGADASAVAAGQYDYQTIITHELGHGVWLGHSADTGSVMYPMLKTGVARRTLTDKDITVIEEADEGAEALLASEFVAAASSSTQVSDGKSAQIADPESVNLQRQGSPASLQLVRAGATELSSDVHNNVDTVLHDAVFERDFAVVPSSQATDAMAVSVVGSSTSSRSELSDVDLATIELGIADALNS